MKIYVGGRFSHYERCRSLIDALSDVGHEITHDWTRNSEEFDLDGQLISRDKGFSLSRETQDRQARRDIQGCLEAELVVIFADEPLCGALIEMGAALSNHVEVWIINPWRWTIFWGHSLVTIFSGEQEVRSQLGCGHAQR